MQTPLTILKIGGNVVNDTALCDNVLEDFARLKGPKILVHGGGKRASSLMRQMGLTPRMVEGRRITDAATLEIVTMVYGGLINKNLVARLQSLDCNALGLSGADANTVSAEKRPVGTINYGFVGDIKGVADVTLATLLSVGLVPVFCALTHDGQGQLLNTNADSLAGALGEGLSRQFAVRLVFCFEKPGVLLDATDDRSVVAQLDHATFIDFKKRGIIFEGMIPKMEGAFRAARGGVQEVIIAGPTFLSDPTGLGTRLLVD